MEGSGWEIRLDEPVGWVRRGGRHLGAAEVESVRDAYDLGGWVECRPAPGPAPDLHFALTTTDGEFTLRASPPPRTETPLRFETRLLEHLARVGYPAPPVVCTRDGRPFHRGGSAFLVTRRVPGRPGDPGNPAHRRAAGRALARYHDAVRAFPARFRAEGRPVLYTLEKNGPPALAAFTAAADTRLRPVDRRRLSRATSYLWSQFIRVPEALAGVLPGLARLVVHGSFGPSTLLFHGDGRPGGDEGDADTVAGLVGYRRAAYDFRALDLADAAASFGRPPGPGFDFDGCADLVTAYGEEADLPAAEAAAMPLVLRGRRLAAVLARTAAFLRAGEPPAPDEELRAVVDTLEVEAERVRWLEREERDVVAAFGSARVG